MICVPPTIDPLVGVKEVITGTNVIKYVLDCNAYPKFLTNTSTGYCTFDCNCELDDDNWQVKLVVELDVKGHTTPPINTWFSHWFELKPEPNWVILIN